MVRGRPAREPDEDPEDSRDRARRRGREDHRSFELRVLLDGRSPREVLARLVEDDPLELWPRVLGALGADAELDDARRVYLRFVARVSHGAMSYRGRPELDAWLRGLLAQAIGEIREAEREEVTSGALLRQEEDVRDWASSSPRTERKQGRRADLAFNTPPDLLALLREAAEEPGSSFLRVSRPPVALDFAAQQSEFGPMTTGLAPAEREIVRVYRQELAELFMEACARAIYERPERHDRVSRYSAPDVEYELRTGNDFDKVHHLLEMLLTRASSDASIQDKLGEPRHRWNSTAADFALAAHRLLPSNRARMWAAVDLSESASGVAAAKLAHLVMSASPSRLEGAAAHACIGMVHTKARRFGRAFESYSLANLDHPESVPAWLNQCMVSFQLGDERRVLAACARLDDLVSATHPAVRSHIENSRTTLLAGEWSVTPDAKQLGLKLRDQVSPTLGGLVDVIVGSH